MNKITVKVTDAVLDVKISPQSTTLTAGESTEVDVTLKNTGNTNLKNIVLYDNSDNKVVLPSASLDNSLGDSMTAKATITPAASGEIVLYAKADDGNGNTTTYNSNIVTMTINEAEPTPSPTPAVDYSAGVTVKCDCG